MTNASKKSVSGVVWPWREGENGKAEQEVKKRRVDSLVRATVLLVVGLLFIFWLRWFHMGVIALTLGILILVGGCFIPPLHCAMQAAVRGFRHLIGISLTWLLLAPFFYVWFTLGRIMQVLSRKDPMCRAFPTGMASYWITHKKRADDHLERQF